MADEGQVKTINFGSTINDLNSLADGRFLCLSGERLYIGHPNKELMECHPTICDVNWMTDEYNGFVVLWSAKEMNMVLLNVRTMKCRNISLFGLQSCVMLPNGRVAVVFQKTLRLYTFKCIDPNQSDSEIDYDLSSYGKFDTVNITKTDHNFILVELDNRLLVVNI